MLDGKNVAAKMQILTALVVLNQHGIALSADQLAIYGQLLSEKAALDLASNTAAVPPAQQGEDRTQQLYDDAMDDPRY